jgi:hypothetical protein
MKSAQEVYQETISKLSDEEKAVIFPPLTRKNFVVRKSWYGRNQVISFTPKPTTLEPNPKEITYNHDIALDIMLPKLSLMPCWIKREYWSQSTNMPLQLRHRDLMTKK